MSTTAEVLAKVDMSKLLTDIGFDNVDEKEDRYLGFCTFHSDCNTKSFSASISKKLFSCFGCGIKGNAITLYSIWKRITYEKAKEELDKQETVRSLDNLNLNLTNKHEVSTWKRVTTITEYIKRIPLITKTPLKVYLNNRGISDATLDAFGIRGLTSSITPDFADAQDLVASGLYYQLESGQLVELLQNHPIIFPYVVNDFVVWAQGRVTQQVNESQVKYLGLTCPITHPYNFHAILTNKDSVFVCEGAMDALSMYELGYTNVIGIPGVQSFKESWADMVRSKIVVLALDNDPAGDLGREKLKSMFEAKGKQVMFFNIDKQFKDINVYLQAVKNIK